MPEWHPSDFYIQPRYSTMPTYLRVEDAFAPTLDTGGRTFWERARDRALLEWAPVGFEIRARDAVKPYGGNRVTLNMAVNPNNIGGMHCFEECEPCTKPGCDWVHVDAQVWAQAWASRVPTYLRYVIAHEFGHSLGFGHGGTGIMDATPYHAHVNDEEIAAARSYWLP